MLTAKEIRKSFTDFFASKGHKIVPSAPMVIKNDPTLMFTNAGMNQFKDIILGNREPESKRCTDSQKCLRVSGKHNDLEEVGHDTYHHTMFEMLGNWSFGEYFKAEAIEWAWELLTKVFKLDPDRLYATVFEGCKEDKVEMDSEAKEAWLKYLPEERILLGNKHDNFWEMGDMGPCGTCSEIHIDLRDDAERAKVPGKELVNKSNPLVIEIWNLVFMQFNRKADGSLEPLPHKNVDTGMGFERLCMAMQGKKSNYDTDVFTPLLDKIGELAGKDYKKKKKKVRIAMRVIADHTRAITFSIADGQLPSNVKAGYVIRRILRRAVRYAYTFLKVEEPWLYLRVPTLVEQMEEPVPELKAQEKLIKKVIKEAEEAFLRTLDKGIKLMDTLIEKNKATKKISGEDAFVLYDTFGFPIDLTELIAKENGYNVDLIEFDKELKKQKERSRNATSVEESDWVELQKYTTPVFTGYDTTIEENIGILKYRCVKAKNKTYYQIVLDKTPFYAESGGQMGDTGELICNENKKERIDVINTIKENGLPIHIVEKLPTNPKGSFTASVNLERRRATAANHSATHLLHHALRKIIGTHVEQKGSLVSPIGLRFDFSHFEKIEPKTLREIERTVNSYIRRNIQKTEYRELPIEEARKKGAMALFGEKYGDKVRMIQYANSVELCGGTHVNATGDIGYFKIISESAVAAGVRRIEATTGAQAEAITENLEDIFGTLKEVFNNSQNVLASIKKLIDENDSMKKYLDKVMKDRAVSLKNSALENATIINGIRVVSFRGVFQPDLIKDVAFMLKAETKNTIFIGATEFEGKPTLSLMYSDDLVAKGMNAGKDIKAAAKCILGGGGGQAFFATAGGKDVNGLSTAHEILVRTATK